MSALCSTSGADDLCLGGGSYSLGFRRKLQRVALLMLGVFSLAAAASPPQITTPPQPRTVVQGDNYTFTVIAAGTEPLAYQWRKDGAELSAKTNAALALTAIQPGDGGNYSVVITNLEGSITSAAVRLTVRLPGDPVYAAPQGGWTYLFAGDAAAGGLSSALDGTWDHSTDSWAGDGRGVDNPPAGGVGTSNGILTLEDAVTGGTGFNNRRIYFTHNLAQEPSVTNASTLLNDGVTLTFRARLTPPSDPSLELTNAPNGLVNNSDGKGMFGLRQAGASGMIIGFSLHQAVEDLSTTANFNFAQAGLHLNNLNGDARSASVDPGEGGTTNILALDPTVFHEFWITIQDNGSDPGTHRVSIYLDGSETATVFNVTAGVGSDGPATNYLAMGLGSAAQRGAVDVDFFGYKPGVQLPAGFNEPVGIRFQPTNVFTATGQVATFSVGVTGTPPFGFQWYRDDLAIADATNSIYTTPTITTADNGAQFRVVITNEFASVTSSPPAVLSLLGPPTITTQPQSLTVTNGDPAVFSVGVGSGGPVSYQWRLEGTPLFNQTNATLALTSAGPANAGGYDVVITNSSGSVTSTLAVLTLVFFDFGDAPDPGYPTLKASDGARHRIVPGVFLGATVDGEVDGLPGGAATGDDTTGSADEDGITFAGPLRVGRIASVAVVASTNGFLNAWFDFDRDSSWAGAGEQVFTNVSLSAGTNFLNFAVPANASLGNGFARFRFSTTAGLSFTGPAADGEVEDYAVTFQGVADIGVGVSDAPDPVATGSNVTYTISVTNLGPSVAADVSLNDILPAGVTFVFAQTTQGSCNGNAAAVACDLGALNSGGTATVLVRVRPNGSGSLTNAVTVANPDFDPVAANNSVVAVTSALDAPSIVTPPANLTVTNGGTATFNVTAAGAPPLRYQWSLAGSALAGATNASLVITNAQLTNAGNYAVRVTNVVGAVDSAAATLTVLVPPSILTQPQSRTNLAGSAATLSVVAAGSAPLSYQWRLNGANPVPGATNASLVFASVQSSNAGAYRVEISNVAGVVTSVVATLTVIEMDFGDAPAPYPTTLAADGARHRLVPGVRLGNIVDFEPNGLRDANATGDDLNGADDEDGVVFNGGLRLGQTASVTVIASTNGVLNAWIDFGRDGSWAEPGDQIVTNRTLLAGTNNLAFLVPANGVAGFTYGRFRFATASGLSYVGEAADGEVEDYAVTLEAIVDLAVVRLNHVDPVAVGSNEVYGITVTNAGATTATGVAVTDALPPGLSFVSASSSQGACATAGASVTCFLGVLNAGASASLTITGTPSAPGTLTNRVTITANEIDLNPANNTAAAVTTAMLAPQIVASPQSLTVSNGATATFSVTATGTSLRYQWLRNGLSITGATNTSLTLTNVQLANEGQYAVAVTNEVGSVTSAAASLSVQSPAIILTQPQSQSVAAGSTATFNVVAAGSAPLSYQWDYNGTPLSGQLASNLVLINVSTNQAGPYRVRVSNSLGSVTSVTATLTVLLPPVITQQPQSRTNIAGSTAIFSGQADGGQPIAYQWFFNQTNRLTGQTSTALSLTNVVSAQAGGYSFVASNSGGQVTSLVATLTVIELDFGDAPESLGYPTTLAFNGARHRIVPGVRLGNAIDFETNGLPNASATGDDAAGLDDEDGVVLSGPLGLGATVLVPILASTNGFIDAWIDFNANGTWADPEDQVLASFPVSGGTNLVPVSIAPTALLGATYARFRFSTAGGLSYDGFAPDGEVEDYAVTIAPGVDLAAMVSDSLDPITLSSNVTLTVIVTNQGPSTATGVLLTNSLSSSMSILSFSSSQGSCSNASGRVVCALGTLVRGGSATVTINARGNGPGILPTVAFVTATEAEIDPSDNTGIETTAVVVPAVAFANTAPINIADATATAPGLASPFPSTLVVSGLTGAVYKVTATLNNISHGFASDLDILLVGPGGQNVMLMSDCGGNAVLSGLTLTLDDSAPLSIPSGGAISGTLYRPTNYDPFSDTMPPPAPAAPFGSTLSVFAGTNPNGTWSLFVMDDLIGDTGNVGGGWRLNISTADPIADLLLAASAAPNPAPANGNLVYTLGVTNLGPAAATGVSISNAVPPGVSFISGTSTLGSCALQGGQIVCSIGNLAPSAGAVATITVTPTVVGSLTNTFIANCRQADFTPANNTATIITQVRPATDLLLAQTAPANLLLGQQATYVLNVTNLGPNVANNVRLTDPLPAGVSFVSAVGSPGGCTLAAGIITCNFGVLAVGSRAQATIIVNPSAVGSYTNSASIASDELDSVPGNNTATAVTTVNVLADLAVAISDAPDPAPLNGTLTYSVTVTNIGPLAAAAVVVTDALPAAVTFVAANASQGSCVLAGGTVNCSLGTLPNAGRATVTLTVTPIALGPLTNSVGVATSSQDPVAGNNTATTATTIQAPPTIATQPESQTVTNGAGVSFSVSASGTVPLIYQWQFNLADLPGATNPVLSLTNVTLAAGGGYRVRITNAVGAATSSVATLTVRVPPVISDVANQTTDEDVATPAIPFTVGDADAPATQLTVSALSSDPTLLPTNNIVFGGSGSNLTVRLTPARDQNGVVTVTLVVRDADNLTATDSFNLTVRPVNDPPTVADIPDQTIPEDSPLVLTVNVGDVDDVPGDLRLSASSSLPGLVATNNIVFTGSGTNRTLTLRPATNAFGTATISVTVTDTNGAAATDTFVLTVVPVNDAPTLDPLANLNLNEDAPLQIIALTGISGGPTNEPPVAIITAGSSDTTVVPIPSVTYTPGQTNGTLTFAPVPNASGIATITVTADDGGASNNVILRTFTVTVNAVNDFPAIAGLTNISTLEDVPVGPLPFFVSDVETAATNLQVVAFSSNTNLVPVASIQLAGGGTNRSVTILPATNQNGSTTITLAVTDGDGGASSNSFVLTVTSVNDAPVLSDLADQVTGEDVPLSIPLAIGDAETPPDQLLLTVSSSDTNLFAAAGLIFSGNGTNRVLTLTPVSDNSGSATLTVTVSDGTNVSSDVFVVTVFPINDPPTLASLPDLTLSPNAGAQTVLLSNITSGAANEIQSLSVTVVSGDPSIIPTPTVSYTSPATTGSFSFTPVAGVDAIVPLTVTVNDGGASNNLISRVFNVTVTAFNVPPTIAAIPDQFTFEDVPLDIAISVNDSNTPLQNLRITVDSSNTNLVPATSITVSGNGTDRTLHLVPATNQFGSATLNVTVADQVGGFAHASFVLTVQGILDAPSLAAVPDQVSPEDSVLGPIVLLIHSPEMPASLLTLTASASDTNLIPTAGLILTGTDSNRTLTITPAANQFGVASVLLSVTDTNGLGSDRQFSVTINPVNDPPTLAPLADLTIDENAGVQTVPLAGLSAGPPNEVQVLTITAISSNPALVPNPSVSYVNPQTTGTLSFATLPNANGSALVTVTVDDGQTTNHSVTRNFTVTVNWINDPPAVSALGNVSIPEDTALTLAFSASDDTTPTGLLAITVTNSNTNLFPAGSVAVAGTGTNRTLTLTPATNLFGAATVTLSVTDTNLASTSRSFVVTVLPVNDPPQISDVPNQTMNEDGPPLVVPFTVGDVETAAGSLRISGTSSNPALLLPSSLVFGGTGSNRTVTLTPQPDQNGSATITLVVKDEEGRTASDSFLLTVNPVNDPPTISAVPAQSVDEDTPLTIAVAVADVETPPGSLTLSASSSDTNLIPASGFVFGGSGATRLVTILPATNRSGSATIMLVVSDGAATATNAFALTVLAVNDPPTLNPINNLTLSADAGLQTVNLTGIGSGAADEVQTLTVTALSSNPGLVPNPAVSYSSPNPTGSLSFTPAPGSNGTATITVVVNDGQAQNNTTSQSFVVTVGTAVPVTLFLEAESGTLVAPMVIATDPLASHGQYVESATANTGSVTFTVNIPQAGDYVIWNRILSPNGSTDSFFFSVDGGTQDIYDTADNTWGPNWQWSQLKGRVVGNPWILALTAGIHNFNYQTRDPHTKFDALYVTSDRDFFPGAPVTNVAPTLNPIADFVIPEDAPQQTVNLSNITDGSTNETQALTVTAASSNTGVIPDPTVNYTSPNTNGVLTFTPVPNAFGSATITVTVSDGQPTNGTITRTFVVTVSSVNDSPTLNALGDISITQNAGLQSVPLTGITSGAGNESQALTIVASSSNPGLIPTPAVTYTSPASAGTLAFTPVANASGSAVITVTITDGGALNSTLSRAFTVTVNGKPSLSHIADQIIDEDTATAALPFVIGDAETAAGALTLLAASSDTNLVALTNIVFGGGESNRTVTVRPGTNLSGHATISVTVTDTAGLSTTDSFEVVVNPVNDPPTLNPLADLAIGEDAGLQTVPLTGITSGAANEIQDLTVTATSSNPGLIPDPLVSYTSAGTNGTLAFAAAANGSGSAAIRVVVSDGQSVNGSVTQQFLVTVNATNDPPAISAIAGQVTDEDVPVIVGFIVRDVETSAGSLTITASSSNQVLVPDANLVSLGSDGNRALLITPAQDQSGVTLINVTVGDGNGASASTSFLLTVNPVNDAPAISSFDSLTIDQGTSTPPLAFTIADPDSPLAALTLSATSSNPSLAPGGALVFGGVGANRTLTVTPATNQTGSALIAVSVSDPNGASAVSRFRLTVRRSILPPRILTPPLGVTTTNGATVVFFVVATGADPLSYEWRRDGVLLTGQSAATLTLLNVQAADAGNYTVTVRNPLGSVTSPPALLRVTSGMAIATIARNGETVTLSFQTVVGRTYVVEYADDLAAGVWTALPSVAGTGGILTVTDAGATSATRFYRLRTD